MHIIVERTLGTGPGRRKSCLHHPSDPKYMRDVSNDFPWVLNFHLKQLIRYAARLKNAYWVVLVTRREYCDVHIHTYLHVHIVGCVNSSLPPC